MRPLEDVRIIALEQYGAGPFGSLHLADLGAEVIKIEDPSTGGDVGRYVPPFAEGEDSLFFETFNRNKRSIAIDLSTAAGRQVFEDLVRVSDAVYSNLRGDVPAKIGIRYKDLKGLNRRIVCCSLTGFGMSGPRQSEPGYDYILQAIAGWMSLTGEPDGPPAKSGLSLVDYSGGLVAALALLAGLHAARRDGVGGDCDTSLYDTAISLLSYPAVWHLNAGFDPVRTRHSSHPSLVPFQAFETTDGWIVVGCAKEKFWRRLAAAIERPELLEDDRFASFAARGSHGEELLRMLEGIFAERSSLDWISILQPAGVPCGVVNDVGSALREAQTVARELVVETVHPRWGTVRQLASPVRFGEDKPAYRRAPGLDEDAGYVLADVLGYDRRRRARLEARGAFGRAEPDDGWDGRTAVREGAG
jgi:crotonobetainyl-CoA:carnitine CoA-transferase CaiB-like acyl-CoA transferase